MCNSSGCSVPDPNSTNEKDRIHKTGDSRCIPLLHVGNDPHCPKCDLIFSNAQQITEHLEADHSAWEEYESGQFSLPDGSLSDILPDLATKSIQELANQPELPYVSKRPRQNFEGLVIYINGKIDISDERDDDEDYSIEDEVEYETPAKKRKIISKEPDMVSALSKHIRKSNNENKCEIEGCEKIFSRARDMKRHMEKVVHPTREMKKAAKLKAIPNTNLIQ